MTSDSLTLRNHSGDMVRLTYRAIKNMPPSTVRYWHKADILEPRVNVRFRG